jgi:CRP/FNR family cyclic AMP-dependent transcriptional regulator
VRRSTTSIRPLLQVDPDLGDALPPAVRRATASFPIELTVIEKGRWSPASDLSHRAPLGVLVVDGVLLRELSIGPRVSAEVVGTGDLSRPWDDSDLIPSEARVSWHALDPVTLVLLDSRVARVGGHYPEVASELLGRSIRRSRLLAYQQLIASYRDMERRLMALFGLLARRWGRVRPDGIYVPLQLRHHHIAAMISARRPSVSHRLTRLAAIGLVARTEGGWLIDPMLLDAVPTLAEDCAEAADAAADVD